MGWGEKTFKKGHLLYLGGLQHAEGCQTLYHILSTGGHFLKFVLLTLLISGSHFHDFPVWGSIKQATSLSNLQYQCASIPRGGSDALFHYLPSLIKTQRKKKKEEKKKKTQKKTTVEPEEVCSLCCLATNISDPSQPVAWLATQTQRSQLKRRFFG